VDTGDTAFMLMSTALVFLMIPGLGFFYAGLTRTKSVLTILLHQLLALGPLTILWFTVGFSMCYSGETLGGVYGSPWTYMMLRNIGGKDTTIPGLVFMLYQGMFAVIGAALISGAFAERLRLRAYILFIILWSILVYYPWAHMIWADVGLLKKWGVRDFAGGIVVHTTSGFSGLGSVLALGSRHDVDDPEHRIPHNIPQIVLGTGLLWFGWFGFNAGSALKADHIAAAAAANSVLAAAAALTGWVTLEWNMGKPSIIGACVGAIAGLASITPAAGYIQPWAAMAIGFLCVPACYLCTQLRVKMQWDDALDVWPVHGVGGALGSIALGFLADSNINKLNGSLLQTGKQLAAVATCAVYSLAIGWLIIKAMQVMMDVSPTREDVAYGLDKRCQGTEAYAPTAGGTGNPEEKTALLAKQSTGNAMEGEHAALVKQVPDAAEGESKEDRVATDQTQEDH